MNKSTFFFGIIFSLLATFRDIEAGASDIVAAARSQIGQPYVWGGGGKNGPSKGGFDCSGLAQYSVYVGTGKTIARNSKAQYKDTTCEWVDTNFSRPGDLLFWGRGQSSSRVYHVGIKSETGVVVHAPRSGQNVKEVTIFNRRDLMPYAQRC